MDGGHRRLADHIRKIDGAVAQEGLQLLQEGSGHLCLCQERSRSVELVNVCVKILCTYCSTQFRR